MLAAQIPDPSIVTISLEYLAHFLSATGLPDVRIVSLLKRLPIENSDNLQARLEIHQSAEFLAWVSKELNIESLGLVSGIHIHPSQWGDIGHLMICSRTIAEALKHAIENEDILNSAVETQLIFKDEWVEHRVSMPILNNDNLAKPFIERDFAALLQSAGFLLNKPPLQSINLQAVNFRHQAPIDKSQLKLYQQVFGCLPTFSADCNSMIYHSQILQASIPSANPPLQSMLLQQIERTRQENNISHSLNNRIQTLFKDRLQQNLPSQQETANLLGMSISTLKRRLQQEGTNYKEIIIQTRLVNAKKLLTTSNTSLTEISLLLGFANASAFNNAFKKWTGLTPLKFRQENQA